MSVLDVLQQIAAYIGSGGAALALKTATAINTALKNAEAAVAEAKAAKEEAKAAKDVATTLNTRFLAEARQVAEDAFRPYRTIPQALRIEVDDFKNEMRDLVARGARSASHPDLIGVEELSRRLTDVERRLDDLKRLVTDERSARHSLGREVNARHDTMMHTLQELNGAIREIKGRLDAFYQTRR